MRTASKAIKNQFLSTCERLHEGRLTLRTPEGEYYHFGTQGEDVEMTIHDWSAISAMAAHGQVGLGEAYVQGLWSTSSIENLIVVALKNRDNLSAYDTSNPLSTLKFRIVDTILRANSRRGSRRNIRSHYDVGNEFYQLWLDEGMTYSSGLFSEGTHDLAQAQYHKNARALSKLNDGDQLLEIGCGWGGFAEHAAESGRKVTGLTISPSQHAWADSRLDGRADIQLKDYRDIRGKFDNIVSIEMIEAVGQRYWPQYFATLKHNLAEGGRVLLQAITVDDHLFDVYRKSSDYIRQYVFFGGMLLSDSNIKKQARLAGLKVNESYHFGQDYARTCRIWAERLAAKKTKIHEQGFDERFFRNWQYYLEICAASFKVGQTSVTQVEMSHAT